MVELNYGMGVIKVIINKKRYCDKLYYKEEMFLLIILNNVYPVAWEEDKDYVSRFLLSKRLLNVRYNDDTLLFCGIIKKCRRNKLGKSLHPHYCNVQILDFKDFFLSQGLSLYFVISVKP